MKKLSKKWIILAAALVVVIAAGVVAFCMYNSTENVAIRSVTNVFESALERKEFQALSELITNGSIEVKGTAGNQVGGETIDFGGKAYFTTENQAMLLENVNFNGVSGSAYFGYDKIYVSGDIVNNGTYGLIAGQALSSFRESPFYTGDGEEITSMIETLLDSYDNANPEMSEEAGELYSDLIEIFYECLLNNVELESETKDVRTGGEKISARVITVEITDEVILKTCGEFLELLADNQDVKDFIEKYENSFTGAVATIVPREEDSIVELYEEAIEEALKAIDELLDEAEGEEGALIEIVTSGVTADLYKLTISDLESEKELFVLDVGEEGIAGSQRIEITFAEEFSILYEIKQDDSEAFKAKLEIDDEEIFSFEIDREGGTWEFEVPDESITLKGKYEEDGDVTTIEVTKMSVFEVDYSEYVKLTFIINTDDPMSPAADGDITNIFTLSEEDLKDLTEGLFWGTKQEVPAPLPDEYYGEDYYY